jgi:hypothetical protein
MGVIFRLAVHKMEGYGSWKLEIDRLIGWDRNMSGIIADILKDLGYINVCISRAASSMLDVFQELERNQLVSREKPDLIYNLACAIMTCPSKVPLPATLSSSKVPAASAPCAPANALPVSPAIPFVANPVWSLPEVEEPPPPYCEFDPALSAAAPAAPAVAPAAITMGPLAKYIAAMDMYMNANDVRRLCAVLYDDEPIVEGIAGKLRTAKTVSEIEQLLRAVMPDTARDGQDERIAKILRANLKKISELWNYAEKLFVTHFGA